MADYKKVSIKAELALCSRLLLRMGLTPMITHSQSHGPVSSPVAASNKTSRQPQKRLLGFLKIKIWRSVLAKRSRSVALWKLRWLSQREACSESVMDTAKTQLSLGLISETKSILHLPGISVLPVVIHPPIPAFQTLRFVPAALGAGQGY